MNKITSAFIQILKNLHEISVWSLLFLLQFCNYVRNTKITQIKESQFSTHLRILRLSILTLTLILCDHKLSIILYHIHPTTNNLSFPNTNLTSLCNWIRQFTIIHPQFGCLQSTTVQMQYYCVNTNLIPTPLPLPKQENVR